MWAYEGPEKVGILRPIVPGMSALVIEYILRWKRFESRSINIASVENTSFGYFGVIHGEAECRY